MLTIGKLGHGQEAYYLGAVADGPESYYVHSGEAPGRWLGGAAAGLGLAGDVGAADFTALLRGADPRTGERLGRTTAVVPGFDLTFSAPKSVSILFGIGDPTLSARMRAAHDTAVADAIRYLEEVAGHGRRGHGGAERIQTTGFVAAAFRHRTSRAGDPNLHSHVVVVNRVLGVDGRWSALDARGLYLQARTAGHLYQASLRHQLADLELTWTLGGNGLGEMDQVPRAVRREFSQRRQAIERVLQERGLAGPAAAQAAALATRTGKSRCAEDATLRELWRLRAEALGFEVPQLPVDHSPMSAARPDVAELSHLLGAQGLTERSSTFGEREVLRAVATALPSGAPVDEVRAMTRKLLASTSVVALPHDEVVPRGQDLLRRRPSRGRTVPIGASERRYTTRELLALERAVVAGALAVQGGSQAVCPAVAVEAALARSARLNDEQLALVRQLTRASDGVQLVNAPAGSGKTTALAAVVEAYRSTGFHVVGTTLSAKAAGVLRDQAGLSTFTIARFRGELSASGGELPPGSVVIIDEAGQVGTRALAEILGAVRRANGKLILVGDPHQLPEIDAGGAYRGLLGRLDVIALHANHRQRDAAERVRLALLRHGDVRQAVAAYDAAGNVTRGDNSDVLRDGLVSDWADVYLAVEDPDVEASRADVVMLGLTNADVDDLNDRARVLLARHALLVGPELLIGQRGYRAGDHVVTRQNDRRLGVLNGERWVVRAVDTSGLQLEPVGRQGPQVRLPKTYAEDHPERLQHAYAITVAVSQGSSVERAFVLGSDVTYREAGYTAASRARAGTHFYVVGREPLETDERVAVEDVDPLEAFTLALERSAAQTLALDTRSDAEPYYRVV